MEITLEAIISLVGLFVGGGGIGVFFTLRWARRKAKAEADRAVAEAMQAQADAEKAKTEAEQQKQNYYQQLLEDLQKHHEELRQERDHYKQERNELRDDVKQLRLTIDKVREESQERELSTLRRVERLARKVDAMRPFLCADMKCKKRQRVNISYDDDDDGANCPVSEPAKKSQHDSQDISYDIEPYNED